MSTKLLAACEALIAAVSREQLRVSPIRSEYAEFCKAVADERFVQSEFERIEPIVTANAAASAPPAPEKPTETAPLEGLVAPEDRAVFDPHEEFTPPHPKHSAHQHPKHHGKGK